jgi:hypothetical protein
MEGIDQSLKPEKKSKIKENLSLERLELANLVFSRCVVWI